MAIKISNIAGTVAAFIRALGSSSAAGAGEGVLGAHLEDLNGLPFGMLHSSNLRTAQYGYPLTLANDGNMLLSRGDRYGSMAIATVQPLLSWFVEGTTLNTRVFTNFATTMTLAQTASGVTLNSTPINTLSTNYQLNTIKQVPLHMKAPLLMRARFRATQWGVANASAEFGYANVSTTLGTTANLNGVYWRMDSAGVVPVLAIGGSVVASGTDVSGLLVNTNFYQWGIIKDDDNFVFTVQNTTTGQTLSRQVLQLPAGTQKAIIASHAQPYMRTFNAASAPSTGTQIICSEWTLAVLDYAMNMTPAQTATVLGLGSEQGPLTYATTSNLANSTVAPTTVPTNTTATTATLDGAIRMAAPAGAVTDLALFSYTVPAPYQYRTKRVLIGVKNLGAIVATTPTQIDFYLSVNGTGVTLAGNLFRKYLGTQTFAVGAAIGAGAAEGPIALDLSEADLITEAGRNVNLIARISTGTATASQVLEINYSNLGHFE